jgi:hypothetical protein
MTQARVKFTSFNDRNMLRSAFLNTGWLIRLPKP